jgi:hypothetical protein
VSSRNPTTSAIAAALATATVDRDPFPHLTSGSLLDPLTAGSLLEWLEREADWELVAESFYCSYLCINRRAALRSQAGPALAPDALLTTVEGLQERIGVEFETRRVQVGAHKYLPGQSVGIHTDEPVGGSETHRLVLHLTRSFEAAHGGKLEFFRSRDEESPRRAFPPVHNSAVAFELSDRSFHRVSRIARDVRYSVVCSFWRRGSVPVPAPDDDEKDSTGTLDQAVLALLDELGARELPHQSTHAGCWARLTSCRSLRAHLVGTAEVLRRWGCDDEVVLAGLLHSAYGALGFSPGLLSLDERDRVRAHVGMRTEQLVFLFSELDRSTVVDHGEGWEGRLLTNGACVSISAEDARALQLVIWANLVEQLPNLDLSPGAARTMAQTVVRVADRVPRRAVAEVAGLARVACRR